MVFGRHCGEVGPDVIEVQVFKQLESDGPENVRVLQHRDRIPTPASGQHRQRST
jgi:hypothetical protein